MEFFREKGYEWITANQNQVLILPLICYQLFDPIFSESKSKPESDDSESNFNSVFINLDICIFSAYICTLLNKLVDDFFNQNS